MALKNVVSYLILFSITLGPLLALDNFLQFELKLDTVKSFLIMNSIPAIYFLVVKKPDLVETVWYLLTILHGLAHVIHPAFFGTYFNVHYTPLFDYIVHFMQCTICTYLYHAGKRERIIGYTFGAMILTAGIRAHIDRSFLQTFLWILMSMGGVYGTHTHMMLVNKTHSQNVYIANLVIWIGSYAGYLYMPMLPQWDALINYLGLFRLWYLNCWVVSKVIEKNTTAKEMILY